MIAPPKDYFGPGPCGNGLRYLSEWALSALEKGAIRKDVKEIWEKLVYPCFKEPGLLNRGPWSESDQEAMDDYLAVVTASYWLGSDVHKHIYWYGVDHHGVYDNSGEGKREAWLWRMPQVLAHMIYAMGQTQHFFCWIAWLWCVLTSGKPQDAEGSHFDEWALTWHLVKVGGDKNRINRWASKRFLARFKRLYPNMMGDVSPSWNDARIT